MGFEQAGFVLQGEEEVFFHGYFDAFEPTWIDWVAAKCAGYFLDRDCISVATIEFLVL